MSKDGHLFVGNKFNYTDKKGEPYLDKYGRPFLDKKGKELLNEYKSPYADELEDYVKQKPNKQILFAIPLGLWFYDLSNPQFDSVYSEYYKVNQKQRDQKLLDSLYIKHNLSNYAGKSRWFDRFFYHNGEAPVLADSAISRISAKNLQQYFINRGWRRAKVRDTILTSGKKAKVQYNIALGRPMIMDTIIYDIAEEISTDLYRSYTRRRNQMNTESSGSRIPTKEEFTADFLNRGSSIKKGDRLDAYVLENEISRLENRFRNIGYFGFNELKDEIIFFVDTANNSYNVPVRLSISKSKLADINPSDTVRKDTVVHKFKRYKYNSINLTLEDNENKKGEKYPIDSGFYVTTRKVVRIENGKKTKGVIIDTVAYIENQTGGKYKNRILADMLAIEKGDTYRLNAEIQTRRNIYKVNNFNIQGFNTRRETVQGKNSDSTLVTTILLAPMDKYSYEIGFEAFNSSVANFGITPNVTFTAKNLFRGAENLSISFGGSLGNIESKKNNNNLFNASELSAQASLSFPKLILPFNTKNIIPKRWGPSSAISLGYNAQYNIGLDKRSYNTAFLYNFTPTRPTVHQITLWNLQYTQFLNPDNYFNIYEQDGKIRDEVYTEYFNMYPDVKTEYDNALISDNALLFYIQYDEAFREHLIKINPDLADSYNLMESRRYRFTQNVLISSFKYDFTYDERLNNFPGKHPLYLRAQVELAGNVFSLFNKTLKDFATSNNKTIKEIVGVPYSQFMKFDLDIRKYWKLSSKKSVNARLFAGIGIPYGNSFSMPFDRSYSVGGPSDVRAWKAFGFGPGTSNLGSKDGYELIAIENFKLLSSVEYRFPLPGNGFEGALFVDAGNIWGTSRNALDKFEFNSFYKELGI
ncbi:MAG: BamA/TamA family outer membrane protein, partial [Flavobacteriaceae bacterium]|nr:BamA/TamA family outer membrane protein [Flavobacteriaceae bacterium]